MVYLFLTLQEVSAGQVLSIAKRASFQLSMYGPKAWLSSGLLGMIMVPMTEYRLGPTWTMWSLAA